MPETLVVDDELSLRQMTRVMLSRAGHQVTLAESGDEAIACIQTRAEDSFDLVVTDLQMPGAASGLDVLRAAKGHDPSTQVVLMTAYASIPTAVEAMKAGAYDYIEKPFKQEPMLALLDKALEKRALLRENFLLRRELAGRDRFERMVGRSRAMRALFELVSRAAPTRTTVLVTGESGTGKELVAQAIHSCSPRSGGPFIAVNCGAIPETLIESELFGHVKGAFTGAQRDKEGLFTAADGGTIFLDEIGEVPLNVQVKLLRVLQERRVQPVGSVRDREVNVRVVAATNRDLRHEVSARNFREDLFYRLNVIQLIVPPLRERREDIPLLIEHFLDHYCDEHGKRFEGISAEAMEALLAYHYPGNVRELENIIERAVALEVEPLISPGVLPYSMLQQENLMHLASGLTLPDDGLDLEAMVARLERAVLIKALERTGGNRTEAAKLLGITFRSMRYRLDKYEISDDDLTP